MDIPRGKVILQRALNDIPLSDSELQLFRVLLKSNLLSYYDELIKLGGDDVQQLCEAEEEEFMEIMDLIGMSRKPLHVRRLQKVLQEWISNPEMLHKPVFPTKVPTNDVIKPLLLKNFSQKTAPLPIPVEPISYDSVTIPADAAKHVPIQNFGNETNLNAHKSSNRSNKYVQSQIDNSFSKQNLPHFLTKNHRQEKEVSIFIDQLNPSQFLDQNICTNFNSVSPTGPEYQIDSKSANSQMNLLQDDYQTSVANSAAEILKTLPEYLKKPQMSQKFSNEFFVIMGLPSNNLRRIKEIRKLSRVYEKASSKPLTIKKACVNEAAVKLCMGMPTLLPYKKDLCALAKKALKGLNNNIMDLLLVNKKEIQELKDLIFQLGTIVNSEVHQNLLIILKLKKE